MRRVVIAFLLSALLFALTLWAGHFFAAGENRLRKILAEAEASVWAEDWPEARHRFDLLANEWKRMGAWNGLFIDQTILNEWEKQFAAARLAAALENRDKCLAACTDVGSVLRSIYLNETWHWSAVI